MNAWVSLNVSPVVLGKIDDYVTKFNQKREN